MAAATLLVAVLAVSAYFILQAKPGAPSGNNTQQPAGFLKGDINHDGSVDAQDADLIRTSSPCNHVDPCWGKVAGKTKDGDNPIYVSDLDINHDDNVNELDTSAMSSE